MSGNIKTALQYELEAEYAKQMSKPGQFKAFSTYVPCLANNVPGFATGALDIDADGDFQTDTIGISVAGYWLLATDGTLTPWTVFNGDAGDIQTDFPSLVAPSGQPIRPAGGLLVSINEAGSKVGITDGFVSVATMFTPGYSQVINRPTDYRRTFKRSNKINFEFRNMDRARCLSVANVKTVVRVDVALNGHRYAAGSI